MVVLFATAGRASAAILCPSPLDDLLKGGIATASNSYSNGTPFADGDREGLWAQGGGVWSCNVTGAAWAQVKITSAKAMGSVIIFTRSDTRQLNAGHCELQVWNGSTPVCDIPDIGAFTPDILPSGFTLGNWTGSTHPQYAGMTVALPAGVVGDTVKLIRTSNSPNYSTDKMDLGEIEAYAPAPEPATMSLLAIGGIAAIVRRRRA